MLKIQTEYRGFAIEFCEHTESWSCELKPQKLFAKEKLADVKKRIDKFIKDESEFTNMEAITPASWRCLNGAFMDAVITSVSDNGDLWIKSEHGREKIGAGGLIYKNNDKNNELVCLYESKIDKIEALKDELADIRKVQMERIEIPKQGV